MMLAIVLQENIQPIRILSITKTWIFHIEANKGTAIRRRHHASLKQPSLSADASLGAQLSGSLSSENNRGRDGPDV